MNRPETTVVRGLLLVSCLLLLAAGCRGGAKTEAPPPLLTREGLRPPPNQIAMRCYVIGWRWTPPAGAAPAIAGFRIENSRVVPSNTVETAAGHLFTSDEFSDWAESLDQDGIPALYAAPACFSASGMQVASRDTRETQYLANYRFFPRMSVSQFETLSPGTDVRLLPLLFEGDRRILVQARVDLSATHLDKFLFAYAFSQACPEVTVDLPVTETHNVAGAVLLEDGGAAVLAHYVQRHRPDPAGPVVYDHLFYILSAGQTNPGEKREPADPGVPRAFPSLDDEIQPGAPSRGMVALTFRWDTWNDPDVEAPAPHDFTGPVETVTAGQIDRALAAAGRAEDLSSQLIGVTLCGDDKAAMEFGVERTWVTGIADKTAQGAPYHEIALDRDSDGVRLGARIAAGADGDALSISGLLAEPIRLEPGGQVLPSMRPDAAPDDVEKYFLQNCLRRIADLGLTLPLDGDRAWRIIPPWRTPGPAAPPARHLILLRAAPISPQSDNDHITAPRPENVLVN